MDESPALPKPTPGVDAIDAAYLTRLLRGLGHTTTTVVAFTREPAGGSSHGGGALHRFWLTVAAHPGPEHPAIPSSLILKESRCGLAGP